MHVSTHYPRTPEMLVTIQLQSLVESNKSQSKQSITRCDLATVTNKFLSLSTGERERTDILTFLNVLTNFVARFLDKSFEKTPSLRTSLPGFEN